MTDNMEFTDIDIMEITDPRNPVLVSETDANDFGVAREGVVSHGNFQGAFLHDMVVKKIGRTWTLLVSYWDGGWVKFNVNDPANPEYIADFGLSAAGHAVPGLHVPRGQRPPGRVHAEQPLDHRDGRGLLAVQAPERRVLDHERARTPAPTRAASSAGPCRSRTYPDGQINGPTIYGGYGCPDVSAGPHRQPGAVRPAGPARLRACPADPGEEKILILQRGQCFFSEKVETAQNAGYTGVAIANHHAGAGNGSAAGRHPVREPGP